MRLNLSLLLLGQSLCGTHAAQTAPKTSPPALSFGQHYAVLNLDMMTGLVAAVENSTAGKKWIENSATWIKAVHKQNPPPLSIYTRIYYSNTHRPEVPPDVSFAKAASFLGNVTADDSRAQVFPAFEPLPGWDVVLQKTRYYAGAGNALEEILRAQKIDTVILSGIAGSGVVLSTVYRLFDLDYRVIVIANNTINTPPNAQEVSEAILKDILPKMPVEVVTVEEAIAALNRSQCAPAVY